MRTYKEKGRIHKKLTRDRKKNFITRTPTGNFWNNNGMCLPGNVGSSEFILRASTCAKSQATPSDSAGQENDYIRTTINFKVYVEPIMESFMIRHQKKLTSFSEVSSKMTLPIPEGLWNCQPRHSQNLSNIRESASNGGSQEYN